MSKNTYLHKTSTGNFKFRCRIPKEIRHHFKDKQELSKVIISTSSSYAESLSRHYKVELEKLIITIKLMQTVEDSTKVIQGLIQNYYQEILNINRRRTIAKSITRANYSKAIDDFILHLKSKEDTSDKFIQEVTSFCDDIFRYITRNLYLKDIDLDDLNYIKEQLMKLPKRKKEPYRSMTVKELLEVKNIAKDDYISVTSIRKFLKWIRRFYRFCHSSRFIYVDISSYLESPKSELEAMLEREPFSVEEVNLSFEVFNKVKIDEELKLIYKILAYTGMRPSEIAKATMGYQDGIHFIDLTDVKEGLKTKSSHRQIPLHKDLVKLGVHKKYEEIKNLYSSDVMSYKFRKQIKTKITANPRKTMYSYRHTLATQLKYAEVNPLIISELLGHAHEGMTMGRYASRYPLDILKEAIDRLEF